LAVADYEHADELVENLLASLAQLRCSARAIERTSRRSMNKLRAGADPIATLRSASPAESRVSLNDALHMVEEARHQLRLFVFATALDEGMTIGELGRMYGFSRQLAARYAKEAKEATRIAV
jgi:hypothetical protein